jgi:hypothetical protein
MVLQIVTEPARGLDLCHSQLRVTVDSEAKLFQRLALRLN